jgi:hypothetical protein
VGYTLFDQQGPVRYLASVGGMNDLLDFVSTQRTLGPLKEFLDSGETQNMQAVIGDITALFHVATMLV